MITAETLSTLTQFSAAALTRAIQLQGYTSDEFIGARFLGITNAGQFCYSVTYRDDGDISTTKVYVNYDPAEGRVSVDY